MLVAVYYNNQDIRLEERPVPKIKTGELLVKVLASGICGTDLMQWYRAKSAPRVLGHEIAGEIVESKSKKFKIGSRVFVSHHVPCNTCKYCRSGNHTACEQLHRGNYEPGGYSEFIRVPRENVELGTYVLPKNISYPEAAMIEPLACAIRSQRMIGMDKGQLVLVLGSGVSGLLNICLAKLKGAKVVATDIDGYRLKKAKEFGADRVVDARVKLKIKADRIIVCTGAQEAAKSAFDYIDRKGVILFFAIPERNIEVPIVDFWRNEITAASSYGAAPLDLAEAIKLIKDRKVDVKSMITHTLALKDIQEAFKIAASPKDALKVVLVP